MTEKQQAVGSIWNVNSWHWEMKNYTEISKQMLQQKIIELELQVTKDIKLVHTKVKFSKAEAEINVRKGKQILVYDFQLQLQVKGQNDEEQSNGSYRIKQILNDDLNDMIIQEVKATGKNKVADQIKKYMKKTIKQKIIEVFRAYEADIMKIESDPNKLKQDQAKREEAIQATKKAREQKGAQKEKLLQEQRQKQRQMKEQAYKKNFEKKEQAK